VVDDFINRIMIDPRREFCRGRGFESAKSVKRDGKAASKDERVTPIFLFAVLVL
jgi:hypothetical protein